ncbi:MAG TPA: glycosyltransferase family 9 protein [Candidatus Binataceae bacterium]|nr:glycosyltransferase family 9 protein [Candidatus Binataceae bacterium]
MVIFPGALGDLICLLPALRAVGRRYRACSVELMARAELAEFAVGRMGLARGHSIDRREVSALFSPAADAAAAAAEFFGAFSSIHSFFGFNHSRPREVLPLACPGKVFFHPFRPQIGGHIAAAYLEAVEEGTPTNIESPAASLELQPGDVAEGRRLAGGCGANAGRYILLMPGSGSPAKNWPAENYLQLARRLAQSTAVLTVLGPAEAHLERDFSELPIISNPALGALAGLARLSSAFVGNDSGVSHLAAAAGSRGVVIFGPTDPARWRPSGAVSVLRRMPLVDLSPQEVAAAIKVVSKRAEWHA